ncbi:MAG TPA: hypothetical protein VNL97_05855 [Solirubrobacterales bacterium]|jgi:hypothetical protein|nr:hypothetical protein [Solirubrobacterales bacterium]
MILAADISSFRDPGLGVVAALIGATLYEPIKHGMAAWGARKPPMRRWYWQVTYKARDHDWGELWSIELVEVFCSTTKIWGTMYRVYPSRYERRWKFSGRLFDAKRLSLVYESVGEDYGSNGTVSLGVMSRWLWCGAFQQIPDIERVVELSHDEPERRATRRIGPDFTEESLIEWIAADNEANDAVRGFFASIPQGSALNPSIAAKHLPKRARRVLLEAPPFPTSVFRGLQAVGSQISLLTMSAPERERREHRPVARGWSSPTKTALQQEQGEEIA